MHGDEQQSDIGIDEDITKTFEHSIAVMVRKSKFGRSGDVYEAGYAAFVGAIGASLGIRCREKRNKARSR